MGQNEELNMNIIILIRVEMATIVCNLKFIIVLNTKSKSLKARSDCTYFLHFSFMSS